jgi:hypothetical protein
MPEDMRISIKGDYLLVEFTGEFCVKAGKRCVDKMALACKEHQCMNILLDCRKMTGDMPVFNRFQVAEYGAAELGMVSKFALVVRPEIVLPDKFVENVAVNRGMNLKVLSDFEQADHWLSESTPSKEKRTPA